jgi:hypothetical protein
LKKIILLLIVTAAAVLADGTLTHDIFDYRIDSFTKGAVLILVLVICGSIAWADSAKSNKKENNTR